MTAAAALAAVAAYRAETPLRTAVFADRSEVRGIRFVCGRPWDSLATYQVSVRLGGRFVGVLVPCRYRPFDPGPVNR